MKTQEIPLADWQKFADAFTAINAARPVSLYAESGKGRRELIARDVELRALVVDTEIGQQSVVVTVDTKAHRHLSHTISKPLSITADDNAVHVQSELGTGFTIEFSPKEALMNPLKDSLREWGFDTAAFEERAKQSIENARGDLSEVIGVLRETLAKTKQTLLDLQKSGEPVADELTYGFERAWEEIEQGFARARKRMREGREEAAARELGKEWLG